MMVNDWSKVRGLGLTGVLRAFVPAAALIAALNMPQLAAAQEAAANGSSSQSSDQLSEVVVTGSRVARSTFTTPNPVTVLDNKDIENLGLVNVGDVPGRAAPELQLLLGGECRTR